MILTTILVVGSLGVATTQIYKAISTQRKHAHLQLEEQKADISNVHTKERTNVELNQNLIIAGTAFGFSVAGTIINPLFTLASLPGFFYVSKHVFDDSYKVWREKRLIGVEALSLLVKVMLVSFGQMTLANLSTASYALNRKLIYMVKDNSRKNFIDVFRQRPRQVCVMHEGVELIVPFDDVKIGDVVIVHTGETIPVDGIVVQGHAAVDQHILTGEAQPAEHSEGDEVFALTVVLSGQIHIKVEKTGEETTAAQIGQILNNTVEFKSNLQLRAEEMTNKTIVPTLLVAGAAFPLIGMHSVTGFLYAHPKYKTIITGSVSILSTLDLASRQGIMIKDGRTLDLLRNVDTVVFDKTGTLTIAQPHVGQVHTYHGCSPSEVLHYAASAEYKQSHPIAYAIRDAAEDWGLQLAEVTDADYKLGHGIRVHLNEDVVEVGSVRFIESTGIALPDGFENIQTDCYAQGYSLVLVTLNGRVIGAIELHPTVRPEVRGIVKALRQYGVKSMYIISGDHSAPTAKLAADLDIDHYFAETLPEEKADLITMLQKEGKSVCYVGDGINDSIAMKRAHVSISLHGASTVATDTAQVVLMDESLTHLPALFDLSQRFDGHMKRSFAALLIPHAMALGGTMFLHFGFFSSFLLTNIGLLGGIGYAMLPLLQHKDDENGNALDENQIVGPHIAQHTSPSVLETALPSQSIPENNDTVTVKKNLDIA